MNKTPKMYGPEYDQCEESCDQEEESFGLFRNLIVVHDSEYIPVVEKMLKKKRNNPFSSEGAVNEYMVFGMYDFNSGLHIDNILIVTDHRITVNFNDYFNFSKSENCGLWRGWLCHQNRCLGYNSQWVRVCEELKIFKLA